MNPGQSLDEAVARLDESMKALEAVVPVAWKATSESLSVEEARAKAEYTLSRGRLPC